MEGVDGQTEKVQLAHQSKGLWYGVYERPTINSSEKDDGPESIVLHLMPFLFSQAVEALVYHVAIFCRCRPCGLLHCVLACWPGVQAASTDSAIPSFQGFSLLNNATGCYAY